MGAVDRLFILMTARTGSSMVTSIFAAHGYNVGYHGDKNSHGYAHFENLPVRAAINQLCHVEDPAPPRLKSFRPGRGKRNVRRILEEQMPWLPWAYKVGVDHWPIVGDVLEDMRCVVVRRDVESTIASQLAKGGGDPDYCRRVNYARAEMLDGLAAERGYPVVRSDEVVAGDLSSIRAALEYCGLPLDEAAALACVDPAKWRH